MEAPQETSPPSENDEATIPRIPPRYWWLKRISIVSLLVLAFLIGLRGWWGWHAHRLFRAEVQRLAAAGEPIFPEDFDSAPVPDEENAAILYEQAEGAVSLTSQQQLLIWSGLPNWRKQPDEVARIIANNQQALDLVHQATLRSKVDWGVDAHSPVVASAPRWTGDYVLSRVTLSNVIHLSAFSKAEGGDESSAIALINRALAYAEAARQGPAQDDVSFKYFDLFLLIEMLVSSRRTADQEPDLRQPSLYADRRQVELLIEELLNDGEQRESMVRGLEFDRMAVLDAVTLIGTGDVTPDIGDWRIFREPPPPSWGEQLMLWLVGPSYQLDGLGLLRRLGLAIQAASAENWPEASRLLPRDKPSPRVLGNPLTYLAGSYEEALAAHFDDLALRRLAGVALAIRLFELDHGRLPRDLAMLMPEHIEKLPPDPFTADDSGFHYDPEKAILYSVGGDGDDDGGADTIGVLRNLGSLYFTRPGGDIVFFLKGNRPQ